MRFYHRTNSTAWREIQKCGYLKSGTYFQPTPWIWYYDDPDYKVLLEIDYTPLPELFGKEHNYGLDPNQEEFCIQFNIFKPIPLSEIRLVDESDYLHLKDVQIQYIPSQGRRLAKPELKRCPFCGKGARIITHNFGVTFAVTCRNTKDCGVRTDWFNTEEVAISAWNKRVNKGVPCLDEERN